MEGKLTGLDDRGRRAGGGGGERRPGGGDGERRVGGGGGVRGPQESTVAAVVRGSRRCPNDASGKFGE